MLGVMISGERYRADRLRHERPVPPGMAVILRLLSQIETPNPKAPT